MNLINKNIYNRNHLSPNVDEEKFIKNDSNPIMNISSRSSPLGSYDNLKGLSGGISVHEIIANAMSKGKMQLPFGAREDTLMNRNHSLNNSSHGVSDALNNSHHSSYSDNYLDLNSHYNENLLSNTNKIFVSRYVDKISVQQRFSTESRDNYKIHKLTPNGRKMPKVT
jgi:hypothetical protein